MDGPDSSPLFTLLRWMKEGPPGAIPVQRGSRSLGTLRAVGWEDAGDRDAVARLARWHEQAFARFSGPPAVTAEGTRQWLVERVLHAPGRVLFWVRDVRGVAVGHLGLGGHNPIAGTVEIIDALTGEPDGESIMTAAADTLAEWARETVGLTLGSPVTAAA